MGRFSPTISTDRSTGHHDPGTPTSSPVSSSLHLRKHPDTPLDFFQTMHRRVRSSMDMDRQFEQPKGTSGVQGPRGPHDLLSGQEHSSSSTSSTSSTPPVRRMGAFQTTRTRLAGFVNSLDKDTVVSVPPKRPGLPARSSSLSNMLTETSIHHPPTPNLTDDASTVGTDTSTIASALDKAQDTAESSSAYPASMVSTESSASHSKRERVMGLRSDPVPDSSTGLHGFVPQKKSDVLPFLDDHLFSDWEVEGAKPTRRPSMTLGRLSKRQEAEDKLQQQSQERAAAETSWTLDLKGKKTFGEDQGRIYRVGWEREVLDMEARVHEAMWEVEQCHTFAKFPSEREPKSVLDIGTGLGLWPISQALIWPDTTFVGIDQVPVQTDLGFLMRAERNARSRSSGIAQSEGLWESVEKRIRWDQGDFLEGLPYDTGVFDMVHIRFCGLGIPESRWYDVLEESARVLKKGGTLEIVEMAYTLPDGVSTSVRNSFSSLLLADLLSPNPYLPIRFNIPTCSALRPTVKPVWEKTWRDTALSEALVAWAGSALGYKGTGLRRGMGNNRHLRDIRKQDAKWGEGEDRDVQVPEVTAWAWVVERI